MKVIKNLFYVLILLALLVAMWVFKSRPQYLGKVEMIGLSDTVDTRFDKFGVPHIYASSEEDAYQALGYAHAQERLFQIEMLRRAGGGRLAEVFGTDVVEIDKFFRAIDIPSKARYEARRFEKKSSSSYYRATMAYVNGVNQYIAEGSAPLEFSIAGIPTEPFAVEDIFFIAGAMSFNFAVGLKTDPLLTHIRDNLGQEYLNVLSIHSSKNEFNVPVFPKKRLEAGEVNMPIVRSNALSLLSELAIPTFYGSNTWAISPSKTEDGNTLLANDTHIGYSQPCTWYEAHLEYPGQRVYGTHIAGVPFPLTAHNEKVGWGVTMLLQDDMDLYCEEFSEDGSKYRTASGWNAVTSRQDTIKVKGEDDVIISVRHTHHGPVVSDFIEHGPQEELSLFWTFLETDCDLLEAFYELGKSKDMASAKKAVSMITAPGLNISYADVDDNIALWPAARLIDRPVHVDPSYILDGASGIDDALGFLPFSENPVVENPPWGYIFSANNLHEGYDSSFYHGYYEPNDRASKLVHRLDARNDWNVEAVKRLIMDNESTVQEAICNELMVLVKKGKKEWTSEEQEALEVLSDWDGAHSLEQKAPSIYYRWLYHILDMSMKDELGAERFAQLLQTNVIKHSFARVIEMEGSPWWDNIETEEIEVRSLVIEEAFKKSVSRLIEIHGDNTEEWSWGNNHQTLHAHPFKDIPLIGRFFNVGPLPAPGGVETVNNSMFILNDDDMTLTQHGPQMRRIINFDNIEKSISIIPTGQSGVIMSDHYKDQAEMYMEGRFRPQLMSEVKIKDQSTQLLFVPKRSSD